MSSASICHLSLLCHRAPWNGQGFLFPDQRFQVPDFLIDADLLIKKPLHRTVQNPEPVRVWVVEQVSDLRNVQSGFSVLQDLSESVQPTAVVALELLCSGPLRWFQEADFVIIK